MENHEPITVTPGARRRRDNEISKEPPTKSISCVVRSLTEEDVDVSKSTMLEEYEIESEGKGTSSKSSVRAKNSKATEEVDKKLERLKEKLLDELKS